MALVEVAGFSYTYPGAKRPALSDICLEIDQGDFVVLAGPSGSGKSTLGKAIAGYLFQDEDPCYSGNILVNNTDMCNILLYKASERAAYIQQNPEDQFCTLTVKDEIAFALENACMDPDEIERRIIDALQVVKGSPLINRTLSTLSGGEKQKIAIATMLAISPDVLILDEPTSNLDPDATQHIFETLQSMRMQKDLTVVIIEHKLNQLQSFDPKLFLIDEGRLSNQTRLSDYFLSTQQQYFSPSANSKSTNDSMNEPLLEADHLSVILNGNHILKNLDFQITPGEFVAMMGPNGSGKSTLLQTIMGFHQPNTGKLIWQRRNLAQYKTSELVQDIGYIFQNPDHQLFTQSVWDEATLTLKNLGLLTSESVSHAKNLLKVLGLDLRMEDHPQSLSYGEKRRLNLASAILHQPNLLLIDEMLIGQDALNAAKAMQRLRALADHGCAVLLVNHHADLTKAYCDRVLFLDAGSITIDAQTETAFKQMAHQGYQCFLPLNQESSIYA